MWISLQFFSHSHGPQDGPTRTESDPRRHGRGYLLLDLGTAPGWLAIVYAAHVAQTTTAPTANSYHATPLKYGAVSLPPRVDRGGVAKYVRRVLDLVVNPYVGGAVPCCRV